MITFKQLESGTPPDIEVTTDDADAEMADLDDLLSADFSDFRAFTALDGADRNEEGKFVFVIPGDEAGAIADAYTPLADFIEDCNAKTIARAEGIAAADEGEM